MSTNHMICFCPQDITNTHKQGLDEGLCSELPFFPLLLFGRLTSLAGGRAWLATWRTGAHAEHVCCFYRTKFLSGLLHAKS